VRQLTSSDAKRGCRSFGAFGCAFLSPPGAPRRGCRSSDSAITLLEHVVVVIAPLKAFARLRISLLREPRSQLKTEFEWLTCNATIEAFWTHARCLIRRTGGATPPSAQWMWASGHYGDIRRAIRLAW
jgi:hypothetical protein